ncbi:MAG: hypothetical protein ACF8R7_10960 [Phycisphaerales bacterium JB039]
MRRTRILDHRGKSFRICQPEDLPEEAPGPLAAEVSLANEHRFRAVVVGGVIWAAIMVGSCSRLPTATDFLKALGFASAGAVILWGLHAPIARARARAAGLACLRAGLCAACGHSLAGLTKEADECVTCPECGAAWLCDCFPPEHGRPESETALRREPLNWGTLLDQYRDPTCVLDHRGTRRRLCTPSMLANSAPGQVQSLVFRANYLPKSVALIVIAGAIMYLGVRLPTGGYSLGQIAWSLVVSCLAIIALLALFPWASRALVRAAGRACLEAGLCATCGYNTVAIEPEPDGCVICPECGAAWLSDITPAPGRP